MNNISKEVRNSLLKAGASLVGFADVSALPTEVRHSLPYAVSIAVALDAKVIEGIRRGPTLEYHAETNRVKRLLIELGRCTASMLRENGYEAIPLLLTKKDIDQKTLSVFLPFKTVATRAGLGWIGKCDTLVTKEYGSAVRLFVVLTDAPLDVATPVTKSECGKCVACVQACPAGAVTGKNWDVDTRREQIYDAFACKKKATENTIKLGVDRDIHLCGICIAACPWTQKYIS